MKKLLALVLALVMTLGLATVGANAKVEYKDAKDITYKEAVDVMSAIGVLGGDENGFRPTDELKRSEGAKIIAYLMLRNKAAEQMTGGNKFTDVPASHWAAGYIEYLAVEGIVGGVGDNKFDPDGPLSTAAFAKMLLGALGYDAVVEGLGGDDWMINVQKLAKRVGLFDDNDNAVASANIKREEAALYAFNMIKSPLVEYENKGSSMSVNGATINFGASNATYKLNTGKNEARYRQIKDVRSNNNLVNQALIIEFAEEYYDKLVLLGNGDADGFGRPANKWTYDGKEIGTYQKSYDLLYTAPVTLGQVYKDLGLSSSTNVTDDGLVLDAGIDAASNSWYFVDGHKIDWADWAALGENEIVIEKESNRKIGGNGTDTYVYYDEGKVRICQVNWYVGDVTGVYAATASKEAYVDISGRGDNALYGTKKTTDYKLDDIVLFTATIGYDGKVGIEDVMKAETVKGTLNSFVQVGNETILHDDATGSVTLAGKKYTYSAKVGNTPDGTFIKSNAELTVVLDKYGYAIDVSDYGVNRFAVVVNAGIGGAFNNTASVDLLLTDGFTTGAVALNTTAHTGANYTLGDGTAIQEGDIVTYTVNSNGKYTLSLRQHPFNFVSGATALPIVENGSGTMNAQFQQAYNAHNVVTGKTIFLIQNQDGNYKAYEGSKAVPTITAAAWTIGASNVICNSWGSKRAAGDTKDVSFAEIVYIDASTGWTTMRSNEAVFVKIDSVNNRSVDSNNDTYYLVEAVVNGVKTADDAPLKITDTSYAYARALLEGENGWVLFNSMTTNSRGVASLEQVGADTMSMPFFGSERLSNGMVGVGSKMDPDGLGRYVSAANWYEETIQYYPLASDASVWLVNQNNEVVRSSPAGVPSRENLLNQQVFVWYILNSANEISYLFWTEKFVPNMYDDLVIGGGGGGGVVPPPVVADHVLDAADLMALGKTARFDALQDELDKGGDVLIENAEDLQIKVPDDKVLIIEDDTTLTIEGNARIFGNSNNGAPTVAGGNDQFSLIVKGSLYVDDLTINGSDGDAAWVKIAPSGTMTVTANGALTVGANGHLQLKDGTVVTNKNATLDVNGQSLELVGKAKLTAGGPWKQNGGLIMTADGTNKPTATATDTLTIGEKADVSAAKAGTLDIQQKLVVEANTTTATTTVDAKKTFGAIEIKNSTSDDNVIPVELENKATLSLANVVDANGNANSTIKLDLESANGNLLNLGAKKVEFVGLDTDETTGTNKLNVIAASVTVTDESFDPADKSVISATKDGTTKADVVVKNGVDYKVKVTLNFAVEEITAADGTMGVNEFNKKYTARATLAEEYANDSFERLGEKTTDDYKVTVEYEKVEGHKPTDGKDNEAYVTAGDTVTLKVTITNETTKALSLSDFNGDTAAYEAAKKAAQENDKNTTVVIESNGTVQGTAQIGENTIEYTVPKSSK